MQGACERETFVPTHNFAAGLIGPALQSGRAAMRALLEAWIEAAIDCLDALDGDPDFEDGGDAEPSLGAVEAQCACRDADLPQYAYRGFAIVDGEIDPTSVRVGTLLGRLNDFGGLDQSAWALGDRSDREAGDDNGIADHGGLGEQFERLGDVSGRVRAGRLSQPVTPAA